jgi:hypothetical protein
MLESMAQQLVGDSRDSRCDAYMQLTGILTAYGDPPDLSLLAAKIPLFAQCIRRDISQFGPKCQASDISPARQALLLLSTVLYKPELLSNLPDDFESWLLDHAILSLQNSSLPRTIVGDHMRILSSHNFSLKLLTNNKVIQLLAGLKDVTARTPGKATTTFRLAIYEKLLPHSKLIFASQASTWVDSLVTSLLHKVKEVRVKALRFALQVSTTIGPSAAVSHAIQDVMDVPADNGSKFVEELCERLKHMVSAKESAIHVPQIWSAILLLLRHGRWSIDQWSHMKRWLLLIQHCFNCSDPPTKLQALIAWDRFVYAAQPTESSSPEVVRVLCKPILSQLQRRKNERPNVLLSQAISSYYHLLYYAFRPSTSHDRLDLFWREYISHAISQVLASAPATNETACRILAAMCWNPQPRVWDEKRHTESTKFGPADLPRLDVRWVRSRLSAILPVFETLFRAANWSDTAISESPVGIAWVHLSKCLSDASSKEIQPTAESMQAVARVLEMLQRVWKGGAQALNAHGDKSRDVFLCRFQFLSKTIISAMGPIPFTDKLLLKTSQDSYQSNLTPTHRHPQGNARVKSPSIHLLHLVHQSAGSQPTLEYSALVRALIEVSVTGRTSRGAQLDLLCQFAEAVEEDVQEMSGDAFGSSQLVWKPIAAVTKNCLEASRQNDPPMRGLSVTSRSDYDKVKRILCIGIKFPAALAEWATLLDVLVTTMRADGVTSGIPRIIEAIADSPTFQRSDVSIPHFLALFAHFSVLNGASQAVKALPPNKIPTFKNRSEDGMPFEKLLTLASRAMDVGYCGLPSMGNVNLLALLEGMERFVSQCLSSEGIQCMEKCQSGLSLWIEDSEEKLTKSLLEDRHVLDAVSINTDPEKL